MLSGPPFRSTFVYIINILILSVFLLTSFHLAEDSLSAYLWLYTLVCAVVQKYHNYSHLWYSFCNQLVLFAQLENVNKLLNNYRAVHVNERDQNKSTTKSCHIQVDHRFYRSISLTNSAMVSLKDGFTV